MRTYKVGVCDKDLDYATALMDYVNGNRRLGLSFITFSGPKAIEEYLSVQDLDLILINEKIYTKETNEGVANEVGVALLTEYPEEDSRRFVADEVSCIYKYQRAEIICNEVRSLFAFQSSLQKETSVVGVYSPIGRCGKTSFARALVKHSGVNGGLYVSMEDFGDSPDRLENNILYLIKSKSPELDETIAESICFENGVQTLYLSSTYLDTHDVSFEDIEILKASLLKLGGVNLIVFDIGSAAITDMRIFTLFENIFMPVLKDEISKKKLDVFIKLLKELGLRSLISRLSRVEVPNTDIDSGEMMETIRRSM